jgi:hypothetical protein
LHRETVARFSAQKEEAMMALLLMLTACALQVSQAHYPVHWKKSVGPPSRQALQATLRRPVKLQPGEKIYEHTEHRRLIRTCDDYARAQRNGWRNSANTYEMTVASSFKEQCDVVVLVLAAKPSRVSYVRNFTLDEAALDRLPPTLSFTPVGELEKAAAEAERQGLSWKKFKPDLKFLKKGRDWIAVEEPNEATTQLDLKAYGDFNGDGTEDLLLFKSTYATSGTFRYYEPLILTRTAPGDRLKAFKPEDPYMEFKLVNGVWQWVRKSKP